MGNAKVMIDETTQKNIDSWLQGSYDEASKQEVQQLPQEELINAFYKHLSFGTGGLRGIMGAGTNRMNSYTVRAATQGLANYILKQPTQQTHSVLIGYDCRIHSREFAEESAKVLAASGIKVFLYRELRPVPLVSFGVLHKKCIAGIMITASHNPPKYNGYKVYWSHGGQVLPPHDVGIIDEVNQITELSMVKTTELSNPLIEEINGEVDEAYLTAMHPLQIHPGDNHSKGEQLKVVYSSLHGAGITMVPKILKQWGFTNVSLVQEQAEPDGHFPTLKSPNPEEPETMHLGIEKLKEVQGDLFIATDPDTDRIGVVILQNQQPIFFNGNEIACLAAEYICRALKATKTMPPKPMFVKTIVTTELFKAIVEHYGASCIDVLTGFKYIGEKIAEWDEEKKANVPTHHFIFGGEESFGYLLGTSVRDKDAVISSALICEMALHLKLQGKTLIDFLYEIYQTYGVYREKLRSMTFEGKEGAQAMQQMMQNLRTSPPTHLLDIPVTSIEDYQTRQVLDLESGAKHPLHLPTSNVIRLWLKDGTRIVVRPSGTEPKIKLYVATSEKHHHPDRHSLEKAIEKCDHKLDELLGTIERTLK